MTEKEAIALYDSGFWIEMSYAERAKFQLFEERLCMPFDIFHEAMEKTMGRPIFTHEFANSETLQKEFLGEKNKPTLEEIINLIPENKRIVVIGTI